VHHRRRCGRFFEVFCPFRGLAENLCLIRLNRRSRRAALWRHLESAAVPRHYCVMYAPRAQAALGC